MTQYVTHSHAEALTNVVVGSAIGQFTLWVYGMPLLHAVVMNLSLLFLSYWRSFFIRRIFNRIANHG